jgi:RNA polymerase sigma factor (sigma-70 family)
VALDSDVALVALLRQRDATAFNQVHRTRGPRLFAFLVRMTGRRDRAEDLYHELWMKLAVHAEKLAPDTDLGGWLYTVARNLAYSDRRAERARPAIASASDASDESAHHGGSPYDWAAANETQARLEQALMELPAPFREVLLLVVVDGLSHEQAGGVLGLSPEALRQRLARARAKLTERLDELSNPVQRER